MKNYLNMFKALDGKQVKIVRVSTLAGYWYCSVRAYLQAQGFDTPPTEALTEGTRIHNEITNARSSSRYEQEFEAYIKQFMVPIESGTASTGLSDTAGLVLARKWAGRDGDGLIVTHGMDDYEVSPEKEVTLVEYKTTTQKVIDNYKLATALFQIKVYIWILQPLLTAGGYHIKKAKIVYVQRKRGKPDVTVLGEKTITINESDDAASDWLTYNSKQLEKDITMILDQFQDMSEPDMIFDGTKMVPNPNKRNVAVPPARYKCYACPGVYKKRCPFQNAKQ